MKLHKFRFGMVVYDKTIPDARIGIARNIESIDEDIIVNVDFADEGLKKIKLSHLRKYTKKHKLIGGLVVKIAD